MKFEDPYETEVTEFEFNSYHRMPSKNHSFLQNRIGGLLDFKYRKEYSVLTAIDLELTTGRAIPDVAIYPKMAFNWQNDEVRLTIPPLVAFEIISPRQAITDITDKMEKIFFPAGVKSVWIIVPSLEVVQIVLQNGKKQTFTSGEIEDKATGIKLLFSDIFE